MTKSLLISLSLVAAGTFAQETKSVLFIGNSYTGVNNLPVMTQSLATSMGDNLTIDSNTPGGTTFNGHTGNNTTLNKISQGTFDYVILQAQSQEPSFPPSQVASQTKPYAEILCDSIRSANECSIPLFYMTWGRENGDQNNCQFYPPICTFDGMNARLRESYLEMADENDAEISPVGAAWKYMRDNYPAYGLYTSDGSHPSIYGSYLAACVHYASIFKKSPVGATYTSSLSATDAEIFQEVAEMIVIDSMEVWRFGVNDVTSDFTSMDGTNNFEVNFTNNSDNANQFEWNFGDGNWSTQTSPTHTFSAAGDYDVELIASNGCENDTTVISVNIIDQSLRLDENIQTYSISRVNDNINIINKDGTNITAKLYGINGQLIKEKEFIGNLELTLPKAHGIYIIVIEKGNETHQFKIFK